MRRYFKKSCAMLLAAAMAFGSLSGINVNAAETPDPAKNTLDDSKKGFDAYRTPFLSGTLKTWIYQGEEFDYESSRNHVFADDQEDGDLTKNIIQEGSIDTSELGDQTVTYRVTDSDGRTAEHTLTVSVLPKDGSTQEENDKKNIKRILYTLPDASHLSDIGFNRGYNHDRQNLGLWLPKDETLKLRLVNHEEFNGYLELKLLHIDKTTEKLAVVTGTSETEPKDSVQIPQNGNWITVKNCYNEGNEKKSADSVPFIYTPKDTTVQPIIEVEWSDRFHEIPYYRYGDDEAEFFSEWDRTEAPFAIIEGQAATFLAPIKNRHDIIDNVSAGKEAYQFHSIDDMLEWCAAFEKQYDAYAGLDFYTDEPYNQNVRAKFFIKANKSGAGLAYYSGDHSAFNGDNLGSYLYKDWTSLHEFGHGYEGAIANQENSFVETTNNIMGYYFEPTYRPEEDFGWLLGGKGSTKLEAYNNLGRDSETLRNSVTIFNDMTAGKKEYAKTLFMFVNMFDYIGPQKATSAMHTEFRKYYYENRENMSSSDAIVDSLSRVGEYNVVPYFKEWHITPAQVLEDKIYEQDLPILYYLRNLYTSDEEAETVRAALAAKGKVMNGIYSLVSNADLAELGRNDKSNVTLNLSIDQLSAVEGKNILIKNGEEIVKKIPIDSETLIAELPVGIYEVELPLPRTADYEYGNEYLIAAKGTVTKNLEYEKLGGNLLADDIQIRMSGMGGEAIAITQNTKEQKINVRINNVEPHVYFEDKYVAVRVFDKDGKQLYERTLNGAEKATAESRDFDFPNGAKIELDHEEMGKTHVVSLYTKQELSEYYLSGAYKTVTYVMTDRGLMQQGWDEAKQKSVFLSSMIHYSEYLMQNMTYSDLTVENRFHNAKTILKRSYELLDEEGKAAYDAAYGRLIGHEQTIYAYHKINSSTLTGTADSQNSEAEGAAKALDGDVSTKWHTIYSGSGVVIPGNSGTAGQNNTYTITLPKNMDIGRLEYVPRDDGNDNGRILTYAISFSTSATGENFTPISLTSNTWENNGYIKSAEFEAKNARRIKIEALSTAGEGGANKFITACEFYLYEEYEKKTTVSYLSDLTLGAWDASVIKDTEEKSVTIPSDKTITADLIGKEFDKFTAKVAAENVSDTCSITISGDGKLLYEFEASAGDLEDTMAVDLAGIRNLEIAISGDAGAAVVLENAMFGNKEYKENTFLVSGDIAAISENMSLVQDNMGKHVWTSSNTSAAAVDESGIITAKGTGETTVTAEYEENDISYTGKVFVKADLAGIEAALTEMKNTTKALLNSYTTADDYDAEEKTKRLKAIEDGEKSIDKAMNVSGIQKALEAAKADLDKIETKTQAAQEALAEAKANAKEQLENYINIDESAQRIQLKRAIAEGKANIDKATDIAGVSAALQAAKDAMDAIHSEKRKFTVTFLSDGKEIDSFSQEVELDQKVQKPTKEMLYDLPEKEGYEFDGWYTDSKCERKYNFSEPVKSNLFLHAKWEEIPPLTGEARMIPSNIEAKTAKNPLKLQAYYGEDAGENPEITWSSSNPETAYTDQYGNVYLLEAGEAQIFATAVFENGTTKTVSAAVKLPDSYEGLEDLREKAWANTQETDEGSFDRYKDGPASKAVDGDDTTSWHSQYNGFTVSEDNPAIFTVEFPRDLSEYEWIKFAQKSGNGHINAYQLAVGDAFDESSYEILNNTETNIHKIEGEKVTEVASGTGEQTLTLPSALEPNGKLGRYLQIRIFNGSGNFAAIRELTAYVDMDFKTNPTELGYMDENRDLTGKIADIEALLAEANSRNQEDYSENTWNNLSKAVSKAKLILKDGVTKSNYRLAIDSLNTAIEAIRVERRETLLSLHNRYSGSEYQESSYTPESWGPFQAALDAAKTVLDKGDAAEFQEIDSAVTALNAAEGGLQIKPLDPSELETLKTQVGQLITQAQKLQEEDFSEEAWANLQTAITAALDAADGDSMDALRQAKENLEQAMAYTIETETKEEKDSLNSLFSDVLADMEEEDSYTPESFAVFKTAFEEAEQVLALGDAASLEDIKEAKLNLQKAWDELELKEGIVVDKTTLNELLEKAKGLLNGKYTEESLTKLQQQITSATETAEDEKATSGKVNRAITELQNAIDGLVPIYTVTFHWNYALAAVITQDVVKDSAVTAPAQAPKRTGYTFTGKWYKDAACTKEFLFESEKITGNVTLYAGWKADGGVIDLEKQKALQAVKTAQQKAEAIVKAGQKNYTSGSWKAFLNAYNAVKNLTEQKKNTMSAQELNKLADNLTKAQNNLKENESPKVTSLKFASSKYQIAKGKSIDLMKELTVTPEDTKNLKLNWKISSNAKYASVNTSGVVKTSKKGAKKKVTVTVETADGKVKASTTVQIMKGNVSKVAAKGAKKLTKAQKQTVTLKVKVSAKGGKPVNKAIKWTSSNPSLATVKGSGKLGASAKVKLAKSAKGKTVSITAMSTDGTKKKVVFKIKVK